MDNILKLIDELRARGAIKIALPEVSVEFAGPIAQSIPHEATEPVMERTLSASELESLLYVETSKM